jgi:prepilin-type processing-associated H-X9-DG protein
LGVLVSLLLPAVQRVRGSASRAKCANNLKQVALALHNYESAHGRLPPHTTSAPEAVLSWHALVLPFLDQGPLWEASARACRQTPKTFQNPPHVGYATPLPVFICPDDGRLLAPLTTPTGDRAAFGSYLGVAGASYPDGVRPGVLRLARGSALREVSDGTSSTLMVGERPPPDSLQAGRWYTHEWVREPFGGPDGSTLIPPPRDPGDVQCRRAGGVFGPGRAANPCDRFHFWSIHGGGANFAFADGGVRFLRYEVGGLLVPLASRAGGELIEIP